MWGSVESIDSMPDVASRLSSKQSIGFRDSSPVGSGLPPVGSPSRQLVRGGSGSSEGDFELHSQGSDVAFSSRFGSKMSLGSARARSKQQARGLKLGAGWSVLRPDDNLGTPRTLEKLELASVPAVGSTADFSNYAMSQLNQMYAHMEQAMSRERARHSSDVHLLMRKVDKDLKDTFRAVREAFLSLTNKVQELLQEVDIGKKSIANIQAKFDAAKTSAAIRGQYVEELEAVLDGQVPNISEAMRKLSEELTCAKIHADKVNKEAIEKEREMIQERAATQAIIRSLEERLNEKEVLGFAGATELPLLPEMAATWTKRQHSRTGSEASDNLDGGSSAQGGVDVIMSRSDATRAVTRNKCVRPPGSRPSTTPHRPRQMTSSRQQQLVTEVEELKKSSKDNEVRVAKQHILFLEAAPSLQLLRDIFAELRENWRLQVQDEMSRQVTEAVDPNESRQLSTVTPNESRQVSKEELVQNHKAPELLDKITHLFIEAFPNLGTFSEVLEAMCEEAKRPTPQLSAVADALFGLDVASDGAMSSSAAGGEESRQLSPEAPAADWTEVDRCLGLPSPPV